MYAKLHTHTFLYLHSTNKQYIYLPLDILMDYKRLKT